MAITKTEIDILLRAKADLAAFKSAKGELGGMQRQIKESNDSFKAFGATARSALGSLGVGISAGAVTSAIKQVIDYGSQITDLATQAGTSSDAFQVLALAGKEAGVEFQQTASSLQFLRKSISETAAGTGKAREAFRALGLDARDLAQLPLERALEQVAKAAANAEDQTTAYGYALKILGAENAPKLQEVLKRLAEEGFDKVAESAKGLVITPEQLKTLDDAGDKLERMKTAALVFGAIQFNNWYDLIRGFKEGESSLDRLVAGARGLVELLALTNPKLKLALEGYDKLQAAKNAAAADEAAKKEADETARAAEAAKARAEATASAAASEKEIAAAAKVFAEAQAFVTQHIAEGEKARADAAREALSLNERAARLGERQDRAALDALHPLDRAVELKQRLIALEAQQKEAVGESNEAVAKRLDYEEKIFEVRQQLAGIGGGTVEGSLDLFFGNLDEASESMRTLTKETEKSAGMAKELGNTFASAFEEAIIGGGNFSDVLRGLAQDILRLFVRQQISTPIANFFSSAFSSFFGGGKATGGEVEVGKFYKVGEQGTELFAPGMSGTIIPNHAIAAAAGGDASDIFNFNYTFTGGVTQGDIARMIPQIVTASKNAVIDGKRRRHPGLA